MGQDQQNGSKRYHPQLDLRPTIGLFIDRASDQGYLTELRSGVTAFGRERGVNVITISGEELHSPYGFEAQRNALYELMTAENIDGLVISGSIGFNAGLEEFQAFCERYRPLPMVTIMAPLEGIPCVAIDNSKGMCEALIHLIEVHGYRRIAFVRGPQGNVEAEDRYRVYTEVLAEYGIPFDPALVAPGNFQIESGQEAIDLLLDQRRVTFEALVAADDEMAHGALEALQRRGIQVPNEVAIVGFDDIQKSRYFNPPLTTVRQPIYQLGWRAAEMAWLQLQGETIPERLLLPTALVVRQSCGCLSQMVRQAAAGLKPAALPAHIGAEAFEAALVAQREHVLVAIGQAMAVHGPGFDPGRAEQLLDAFLADLNGQAAGSFVRILGAAVRHDLGIGKNVDSWHELLSVLRRQVLPYLADRELLFRAEDLWQQARAFVGEVGQQTEAYEKLKIEQQTVVLREISEVMITTYGVAELIEIVARELPRLSIPSCYLSLYEDPAAPTKLSRLILAYDEHGRVELEAGGQVFPSQQLVPSGTWRRGRQYNMVMESLYVNEQQLGFVLFGTDLQQGEVFEALRGQLSSALQRALLIQREKHALAAVEEALEERARLLEQTQEKNRLLHQEISQRQQVEAALQKAHDELEQRVAERTAELAQANVILKEQIVERQRVEELRAKLEMQLHQAQKMEAIGQLAGGIAHDFNNLLMVIIGYSNLLLNYLDVDDSARKEIEQIQQAGERAAMLTRQLLAFSRKQVLQPRVLSLNSVVTTVEMMLRRLIGEDIKLATILDPMLAPVNADLGQLEQIIVNLAVNSRDAMPQGGQLTIETANVYLDQGYTQQHVGVKAGSYVVLRVGDTGMGMDAETQAHIFEPFFTTKLQGKGTGLGLATVFGIVQQSGGHITVDSAPAQGTTFTMYLPQSEQGFEEIELEWRPARPSGIGSETILLVEDDAGVRATTRRFLEEYGYTVLEAPEGLDALHLCQQHNGPIHLVITDVVMPGMSGRALVERLASMRPEMPALYVSGYTDSAIIRHGVSQATITLLQKPFTASALACKVREILDLRHVSNSGHCFSWSQCHEPPEDSTLDHNYCKVGLKHA
jgi:DNA-binding LacI/PurR family transcriptional regulator/signal transduction histidine kinase/ActR/RegA family two-component response regulator